MRIVNFLLVLMAAFGTWQVAICTSLYGNVTDRLSLIAFKEEAISLDPTKALVSWNDSTHFCNWEGLIGQISPSLGNLTFLRRLVLSKNAFTGEISLSITRLRRLQILILTNTLRGMIPNFANSSSLKNLQLANNVLVGQFPDLPYHLQHLELEYNGLTGTIPASLANITTLTTQGWEFMNSSANCTRLHHISLASNHLEGPVPKSLGNLSNQLQVLYLGKNKLSGGFPSGIENLPNLVALAIHDNQFTGELPKWLGTLKGLQIMGLSRNNFTGFIPSSLSNLTINLSFLTLTNLEIFGIPTIIQIDLSSNNLDGQLPREVVPLGSLHLLEQLDLSFNHLQGEVPTQGIFRNVTALRIDGNQELCGGALELHLLACPVIPVRSRKKKHSIVPKVAIPLASIVLLVIVISVMVFWKGKQKANFLSMPSFHSKFPKVSYSDLARATEGFSGSNLIGKGRYSCVYQGKLFQDRTVVAVKVFSLETGAQKSFVTECNSLRNLRHLNLVPILTACSSSDSEGNDFKALVYKFMPRGDLHALLYSAQNNANTSTSNRTTLAQRLCIVVDVAGALEYLHHSSQGTIVHCDLKPRNILLDNNMTAHIGDFGLARFKVDSAASSFADSISASSIGIKGTIGYVAPEKRPTDDMFKDRLNIVRFVEMNFPDRILQIMDPDLVGLSCANPSPNERMDMQRVAAGLHGIKEAYLRGTEVTLRS
uniref:Protein kinase domain-containing protein n=1 Tax=Setaria viridis TaxID=4556 RepID=A0A4U6TDK0_SETVI|nr:hypothetical protein SEVIR_8G052500v2 [Setaria viridis]